MTSIHKQVQFEEIKTTIESIKTDILVIIADLNVYNLYGKKVDLLDMKNKKVILWKCPAGENCKNFEEFERCVEFILEKGVHRKCHVLAIGGGATSDFAGFVAHTLLRGVSWSVVPTTLLSMIDASIGGKVGINSNFGKNLIGGFHLPENIIVCQNFLETLPEEESQSGLGELLKYCFLDETMAEVLRNGAPRSELILKCMSFKQKIVTEDLKESGKRKILNMGHSFGHALEKIYELKHGLAVVWGIALIFKLYGNEKQMERLREYCSLLGLNLATPPWYNKTFHSNEIMDYLTRDKKTSNIDTIELVLMTEQDEIIVEPVPFSTIRKDLEKHSGELKTFRIR